MNEQIITALIATIVSALVAFIISGIEYYQGSISLRIQTRQDISSKYNRMIDYRLQQPEVLSLARQWNDDCFDRIYHQKQDADKNWAIYYGYVELCIEYCNSVLLARSKKFMDLDTFKSEHEPLIRLILAEHYPILSSIIKPNKYVSQYLVDHVHALQNEG